MFDCIGVGCHDCCLETRMPLSLADIGRLKALGYPVRDFVVLAGGERRLRNVDGRCFFLGDGGCTVYDDRPAGCRFYPLLIDGGGRVFVDPGCRHCDGFSVDAVGVSGLRGLVKLLRRERRRELIF